MKKEKNIKVLVVILFTIILLGTIFVVTYKISSHKIKVEEISINSYLWGFDMLEETSEYNIIDYEMILEIPKIDLKKGILNKYDNNNNVDKNIQFIKESAYPNTNGVTILAGHSGNTSSAYFKNLDKLDYNDKVYIYYNKNKYEYIVIDYYYIQKTGYMDIKEELKVNSLLLVTCKKNSNEQLIYVLKLNEITNY